MGLFRDLGRRAERFRRQVDAATDATHECRDCGEHVVGDDGACPACGSEELAALE